MKPFFVVVILTFLLSGTRSFSQTINLPADSVSLLLCKKWGSDYAFIGSLKISKAPGATDINYEFNKDQTFLLTTSKSKEKTKGTWSYDSKKKIIKLTVNGRSNTSIVSLKEDELVMLIDTKKATPDEPRAIKLFYKVKGN